MITRFKAGVWGRDSIAVKTECGGNGEKTISSVLDMLTLRSSGEKYELERKDLGITGKGSR